MLKTKLQIKCFLKEYDFANPQLLLIKKIVYKPFSINVLQIEVQFNVIEIQKKKANIYRKKLTLSPYPSVHTPGPKEWPSTSHQKDGWAHAEE